MGNYYFDPFQLDTGRRLLLRDGKIIQLTPKALDILQLLIEHQGQIVVKEQIIKHVWNDRVVVEENKLFFALNASSRVLFTHGASQCW